MSHLSYVIFFLSGVSALIFETLWFRVAGLTFGNSVWGATVVLAAFMAGLAGGTGALTFLGHRLRLGFRLFAAIEVTIGLSGVVIVLFLPRVSSYLAALFQDLDAAYSLNLVRFLFAFVVLVVPSFAMGMTLPTMVSALHRLNPNYGQVLGRLYGWNTAGAVIGALAGEVALIRWYGLSGTAMFSASLNLLAAMLALHLRRSVVDQGAVPEEQPAQRAMSLSRRAVRLMLTAACLGFLMLALEIIWFRLLLWFHASTSLTFATMLAVVLLGIAFGGMIAASAYRRNWSLDRYNRALAILTGVGALAPFLLTITYIWPLVDVRSWPAFVGLCLFVMLPSTVLSGLLFTTVGKALSAELAADRRATALLVLMNTLGAMSGALAATLVLIPQFGVHSSIIGIGVIYGLVAGLLPGRSVDSERAPRKWPTIAATAALLVTVGGSTTASMRPLYSNYYKSPDPKLQTSIVGFRESATETILYHRVSRFGEPKFYRLITNGHSMSGSTTFAKRFMKLYVYLPEVLHPRIERALLISYGVGSTAKALTDTRSIEHIDMVDISRDVLEMSSLVYPDEAENPLNDERVDVHIEDGRFFLATTPHRYELITADPPPPKNAGIVNLYTQEYFELIHDRLSDGGISTYWLPVFDLTEDDTLAIIKAFCNAFDRCSLWSGIALNWILVGVKGEYQPIDPAHFTAQWRDPVVGPELRDLGFEAPEQFASLFLADHEDLVRITRDVPPLTDDFPLRLTNEVASSERPSQVLYDLLAARQARFRFQRSDFYTRIWPREIAEQSLLHFETQRILNDLVVHQRPRIGNRWHDLHLLLTRTELETMPLWALGSDARTLEIVHALGAAGEYEPGFEIHLAYEAMAERDYPRAIRHMTRYMETTDYLEDSVPLQYVVALCLAGERGAALGYFDTLEPSGRNEAEWREFLHWFPAGCEADPHPGSGRLSGSQQATDGSRVALDGAGAVLRVQKVGQ